MYSSINAFLAPMAGYTDAVFRSICGSFGAAAVTSEMISAVALTRNDRKTAALASITENEPPVMLQIFGHDAAIMAEAADILLSGNFTDCSYASKPAGIDINMGCPVKKIVSSGDGSALMLDPENAARITSAVKEVCAKYSVPLSVKFRLGWDRNNIIADSFASAIAKAGADILTVHCRTREQMYAPEASPDYCRTIRDRLDADGFGKVKLIGNGDVDSLESAHRYLSLGCDYVAVGRAALGNPWLFSELKNPDTFTPPSIDERISLIISYVKEVVRKEGEIRGIRESRSRAAYLLHGIRGGAKVRDALNHADTLAEFEEELLKIKNI